MGTAELSLHPRCGTRNCALPADDPTLGTWRSVWVASTENYIALDMVQYVNNFREQLPA